MALAASSARKPPLTLAPVPRWFIILNMILAVVMKTYEQAQPCRKTLRALYRRASTPHAAAAFVTGVCLGQVNENLALVAKQEVTGSSLIFQYLKARSSCLQREL